MATVEQLKQALVKADQAGNYDDAKMIADMIKQKQQTQTSPAQQAIEASPKMSPEQLKAREKAESRGFLGNALQSGADVLKNAGLGIQQHFNNLERQGLEKQRDSGQKITNGFLGVGLNDSVSNFIEADQRLNALDEKDAGLKEQARLLELQRQQTSEVAPVASFTGSATAEILSPTSKMKLGKGLAGMMTKNAADNAIYAGAGYVDDGESRLANSAKAGAAGAAATIPFSLTGKLINARAGKIADGAAKELDDLGRQFDVPVMLADSAKGRRVSKILEKIPAVGLGKPRRDQNKKAHSAAKRILAELGDFGDGSGAEVLDGFNRAHQAAKSEASKRYASLSRLDEFGNVPTENYAQAAREMLAREMEKAPKNRIDKSALVELQELAEPSNTSDKFTVLQNALSDMKADVRRLSDQGSKKIFDHKPLKDALEKDLKLFAARNSQEGDDFLKQYEDANAFYRDTVKGVFDNKTTKKLQGKNADEVLKAFVKSGKYVETKRVYNALDEQGKKAFQYGVLSDIFKNAHREVGGQEIVSPAKIASGIERFEKPLQAIMGREQYQSLMGFKKLMRHIELSGQYMENPPTGNRLIDVIGGGTIAGTVTSGHLDKAILGSLAVFLGRQLMGTDTGRRLLQAASKAEPNSRAMRNLYTYTERLLVRGLGQSVQ